MRPRSRQQKRRLQIYLAVPSTAQTPYQKNYQKVAQILKKLGHKIFSRKEDSDSRLKELIAGCDVFVAEVSFPSIAVAYEISLALKKGKPTLILYSERNQDQDLPGILEESENDRVLIFQYKPEELADLIKQSLEFLGEKMDQRFTFFITPKIAHYLDEIAQKQKIPRAVYIRRLIEEDMRRKEKEERT